MDTPDDRVDEPIAFKAPLCWRILASLRGGISQVSFDGRHLTFLRTLSRAPVVVPLGEVDTVTRVGNRFNHRLIVHAAGHDKPLSVHLSPSAAATIEDEALGLSQAIAAEVEPVLRRAADYLSAEQYRRHSAMQEAYEGLPEAVQRSAGKMVQRHLAEEIREEWPRLQEVSESEEAFDKARESANDAYVERTVPEVRQQVEAHLEITLNAEQTQAIATDEDVTLVVAGAGSGKTAVILGKVAHLIEQGVDPREILVLAFNRDAAAQVQSRLPLALAGVDVSTFHAFGNKVIGESMGVKPTVSKLAENDTIRLQAIDGWIGEMVQDPRIAVETQRFLLSNLGRYASPFEFESMGAYHDHVRREGLRTLNGEQPKSFEELEIANFLAALGVRYEYETNFKHPTADKTHRQYQPDFYLPGYDIYIEHFGVDRDGQPPKQWGEAACELYVRGMEWKRATHERYGTELIETYSWQRRDHLLLQTLRAELERRGVVFEPIPDDELLRRMKQMGVISRFAKLVDTFLNHVLTARLTPEDLVQRVCEATGIDDLDELDDSNELDDSERSERIRFALRARFFLELFEHLRAQYELALSDEIDFHQMVNLATDIVAEGRWASPYKYVLVDEFQDIALERVELLKALNSDSTAYFLVGDDWQAINRFAGSDVELMLNVGDHLGHVRERQLNLTYRFGDLLLKVSAQFVKKNPTQSQREPKSAVSDRDVVVAVSTPTPPSGKPASNWRDDQDEMKRNILDKVYEHFETLAGANDYSVLVLGRYKRVEDFDVHGKLENHPFSTVHKAKGLEADYVVIPALKDDRFGFPAQIEDDELIQLVTPVDEEYEFAEERRLFYVAMTRARKGVYLVADPWRPSKFVIELLNDHGDELELVGDREFERWPNCVVCKTGALRPSRTRKTLVCTTEECPGGAIACDCNRGYRIIDLEHAPCTDHRCTAEYPRCPKCNHGLLRQQRNGKTRKPFWSCSVFGPSLSCDFTQDFDPREYPSYPCPKPDCDGMAIPKFGNGSVFFGCTNFRSTGCDHKRNSPPADLRSRSSASASSSVANPSRAGLPSCPFCATGVLRMSDSGKSLNCDTEDCQGRAVACECRGGYRGIGLLADSCSSDNCTANYKLCPLCKQGIMWSDASLPGGSSFMCCSEADCDYCEDVD